MNATHIDLLLKNCKAYAMDEKNTCYTTIGIHGGRIVYTGQADENSAPCAKDCHRYGRKTDAASFYRYAYAYD